MVNGFVWDLWAIAFGLIVAGIIWLVRDLSENVDRPHDYEKDWPEFRCPKDSHVKVMK